MSVVANKSCSHDSSVRSTLEPSLPLASTWFGGSHRRVELLATAFTLILYVAMLVYAIPRHEPWADEAQAWELAKTLSLKSLFGTYLHYECSPGLWHLVLWIEARLHVTYVGMHWVSGLIALMGVGVLIKLAPFPLPVRLLLPFTYFLSFQYAVIARSYVLFPLLLFALAVVWGRRFENPMPVFLILGLIANLSAHGLAITVGVACVLGLDWFSHRNELSHGIWFSATVFLIAMMGFAAWCIMPAPDAGWVVAAKQMQAHGGHTDLVRAIQGVHPWMRRFPFRLELIIAMIIEFQQVLCQGITDLLALGLLVWCLLGWRLWKSQSLQYMLPVLALAFPCTFTPFHFYHAGLFWLLFIFLWWVTWPQVPALEASPGRTTNWPEKLLLWSVVLCIAIQISWAMSAFHYDAFKSYSPDRDAAVVLADYLRHGRRIDFAVPSQSDGDGHGQFYIVGLEPYFPTQPFSNMSHRLWFWGWDDAPREKYLHDSLDRSAVVVVEEINEDERYKIEEKRLEDFGYRRVKEVCGQVFYPNEKRPPLCHAFYEP
jgi:hypothetical protein